MNKLLYLILFQFSFVTIYAQDCKLKGTVLNEIGIPISDASVSVFDSKNEGKGFVFTNSVGEFELTLPCDQSYEIEIEQPGYETLIKKVELNGNKNEKIKLVKGTESISLQETIIKAQQAIKIKGDTVEYDADSFKVGNEEVLEDILKKLPGIEVENGKVYHKGKEITTITVGGREVLGGNTKLLNKNLPSDAVSKIQLNTKFKSNPFASSLQEDEQASLNIELKDNMKQLVFGNATLGGDADEHADAQLKTFYFSEKMDATVITDFNTYGKEVFDREDYFSFFGGFSEFSAEGSIYSLRGGNSALNFGSNTNAAEMNTFNGAAHFGYEPNKKVKVSGFGLINTNNIRYKSIAERKYNDGFTEKDESENKNNLLSAMGRLRIDWNPNDKGQVKYRLNFNYTGNDDEQGVNRFRNDEFVGFNKNITDRKNYSISQTLSYVRKVKRDHNIGFYLRHQYQQETPNLFMDSEEKIFNIFNSSPSNSGRYLINQDQEYTTNTFQLYMVYNHLINNTTNLKLKVGTNFSMQDFNNKIYDQDILVMQSLNGTNMVSKTDFDYNETFADATLTKKIGKFQADLGAGISYFNEKANFVDGKSINFDETKVLPHANLKYNFNNATSIFANYNQAYSYPHAKDLTDSYVLQNYRSVFRGNNDLRQALTHTTSLNFSHFNSFTFFNVFANLSYTQRERSIQTVSRMDKLFLDPTDESKFTITQENNLINSDYEENSYNASLNIGKRFFKWYNIRFNANASWSDYYTYTKGLNDTDFVQINNKSFNQNYTLTNTFTFKKKVELKAGLNASFNKFQSRVEQEFANWRPFGDIAWSVTDKLLLQSDFSYRLQYRDGDRINEGKEWNASIRYNAFKKTYITLVGGNLLGNNVIVNNSFNDNYIQTTTTDVLGRYFLVNLRYKF
ncbi:outer membrane beta-barrel protein [Faecalibacter rhinopitheci]|uniref:TonB-dependent receptor n=1 Tax=Faecalibacter rhinopitheci TaxID=2779678 RepID=A0A8J7FQ47_9FLAO|nr:outer membrane beta-barrel protein [Faecalibacter rhinopitheci]MBF0597509.1 TonB-dependent receptor [Faecalibacter rhinopitheci]